MWRRFRRCWRWARRDWAANERGAESKEGENLRPPSDTVTDDLTAVTAAYSISVRPVMFWLRWRTDRRGQTVVCSVLVKIWTRRIGVRDWEGVQGWTGLDRQSESQTRSRKGEDVLNPRWSCIHGGRRRQNQPGCCPEWNKCSATIAAWGGTWDWLVGGDAVQEEHSEQLTKKDKTFTTSSNYPADHPIRTLFMFVVLRR